ncbi:hypothetical protein D9756_006880 [Leucocoprinus leucothites]|uniref:F-box domain-containing protein n=1 Tax=Leucocoprinus leucothites TaxID=201217 RepID=A0A8H5FZ70_9AGAR|nr:hypothetical protein D9756_006880 [Leucoagaricus leucothites]
MSTTNCFALCPPDILLEIIHYSLPPLQDSKQRHIELTSMRVVCQYWNSVITSTPQFWSTIQINFPSQAIQLPTVQQWLTRSSDASLNIFIKDRPPISWTDAEIQLRTDLMSAINLHISRCKSLQLEVTVGILPAFRLLRVSEAERLESLEINMRGNTDEHVHAHLIQQLSTLSSLLHLSIATHVPHFITRLLHHCNPTWLSQLTCVRLSCPITTREMLALMEKCTSATQICLNQVLPSDPPTSPISAFSPSVTLKALTSLDISFTSSNTYLILLQRISFPNLKTLHLSGIDISDLSSTVHSSAPHLTSSRRESQPREKSSTKFVLFSTTLLSSDCRF